jgi:N-acetylmuramoyl-L-alanine amidase
MRALAALALLAAAAPASGAPVLLERVEVRGGTPLAVRLELSGPATPLARTLAAGEGAPDRIYVDIAGGVLGPQAREPVVGSGPLVRVRTGQFDPHTARVVLDLTHATPYDVEVHGRVVTIVLREASPPLPAAPPPAEANPTPPPPQAPPPTAAAEPLIIIDPGHGGRDPGASGVGGVLEKDVALAVAQRLAAKLPARLGVNVLLTRSDDSYVPVDERLPPPESTAAAFVSLHANACSDPHPRGLEVFYGGGRLRQASLTAASPEAALLGRTIARALRIEIGPVRHNARPADFAVLARNPVPSVLVEVGFLTQADDALRAQDAAYQDRLTDALVDGLAAFLERSAARL